MPVRSCAESMGMRRGDLHALQAVTARIKSSVSIIHFVRRSRPTMRKHLLSIVAVAISTWSALAMSDNDLRAALEQRFKDDRTGACIAAAVIDNGATVSAYVCADPRSQRPYDEHTAFEIGSVTKTMTAALKDIFAAQSVGAEIGFVTDANG
jgi:CubicO group peptidase (beta-lactamase class C family)